MPKQQKVEAVLYDWVCGLKFQTQALLLTAMRGPDENNKYNAAKAIIRYLRGVVIKPAGNLHYVAPYHFVNDNDFMWGDYQGGNGYGAQGFAHHAELFWADHDEYPHHFIMHLIHCAEVVGYKHPDAIIREYWNSFYLSACEAFHMNPETHEQMDARLNDFGCGIQ